MGTKIAAIDHVTGGHYGDHDESEEEYAYQGTSFEDHTITGFRIVPDGKYFDMVVPFNPVKDVDYYLVQATYSTGDSFSNCEGKLLLVDLFTTEKNAKRCKKAMDEHHLLTLTPPRKLKGKHKRFNESSVRLKNDMGVAYDFGVPYHGYFNSLTGIDIWPIRLRD